MPQVCWLICISFQNKNLKTFNRTIHVKTPFPQHPAELNPSVHHTRHQHFVLLNRHCDGLFSDGSIFQYRSLWALNIRNGFFTQLVLHQGRMPPRQKIVRTQLGTWHNVTLKRLHSMKPHVMDFNSHNLHPFLSLNLSLSLLFCLSQSHTHTHTHTHTLLKQLQVVPSVRAGEVCLFYNYNSHCVRPTAVPQTTISASVTLFNGCQITPCGLCWERPLYLKLCRNFSNNRDTLFLCYNLLSSSVFDTVLLVILSFVRGDTCSFFSLFIFIFPLL